MDGQDDNSCILVAFVFHQEIFVVQGYQIPLFVGWKEEVQVVADSPQPVIVYSYCYRCCSQKSYL